MKQAKAARHAGNMAALAGGLAVIAAVIVALTGYFGIARQITAERKGQRQEQEFAVRRDVYMGAASSLFAGLLTISKLADTQIEAGVPLAEFTSRTPDLARIHMVASIETAEAIISAVAKLSSAHLHLFHERYIMKDLTQAQLLDALPKWLDTCLAKMSDQVTDLSRAIALMRAELEFPIDQVAYQQMVERVMRQVTAEAKASTDRLLKTMRK